jgi:hypothetical protein
MPPSARQAQDLSKYLREIAGAIDRWGEHGRPDDAVLREIEQQLELVARSLERVVRDKEDPRAAAGEIADYYQVIVGALRRYAEGGSAKGR